MCFLNKFTEVQKTQQSGTEFHLPTKLLLKVLNTLKVYFVMPSWPLYLNSL